MFTGIILLAGSGVRFDREKPKQFHRLSGKKVYLHTLESFLRAKYFDEILLLVSKEFIGEVEEDVGKYPCVRVVEGGSTRQESSRRALEACKKGTQFVVIHDGVRPFVSEEILLAHRDAVQKFGAVNTCTASFDTIVHSLNGETVTAIPDRRHYLRGQTPQSFAYNLILEAHQKTSLREASDDCQLITAPIHIVQGDERNIKITTPLDLFLAEQLVRTSLALTSPQLSLKGKKIVVVGAGGGIGSSIVEELKRQGVEVCALCSKMLDVTDERAVSDYFEALGPVDALVNAFGYLRRVSLRETSFEEIQNQMNVNLLGVIYLSKHARVVPGGHLINIASSSFTRGRAHMAVYSASKAGVVNFTQALAEERPEWQVNVVVPQRTNTEMRKKNFQDEDETLLLAPEEVAKEVVELLATPFLTGQIIEVRKW